MKTKPDWLPTQNLICHPLTKQSIHTKLNRMYSLVIGLSCCNIFGMNKRKLLVWIQFCCYILILSIYSMKQTFFPLHLLKQLSPVQPMIIMLIRHFFKVGAAWSQIYIYIYISSCLSVSVCAHTSSSCETLFVQSGCLKTVLYEMFH